MLCLVETKIDVLSSAMANELMGMSFDYVFLLAMGASGNCCSNDWSVHKHVAQQFSMTVCLVPASSSSKPWSLATVYGPVEENLKLEFLNELREIRMDCDGPLLIYGDFNLIYQARDKNNDRLNLRSMCRFCRALDDMQVDELYLHVRLYTWSNERQHPTMEHIDCAFTTVPWLEAYPNHHLRSLSSDCSDHDPLLLQLQSNSWAKPRFRFEGFWVHLDGFDEIVKHAWACPLVNMDACHVLDYKLRQTAKALKSWKRRSVGSVRMQLTT